MSSQRPRVEIGYGDESSSPPAVAQASGAVPLAEVAILPAPGDNVGVAIRQIEAGTKVLFPIGPGEVHSVPYTVLEGHRLAAVPIPAQAPLLSWGLTFGFATDPIGPGEYARNQSILEALKLRRLEFELPPAANFVDHVKSYQFDPAQFEPAAPMARAASQREWQGFERAGGRGAGTRNYVVLFGLTSLAGSFVRALESRASALTDDCPECDGVVGCAHTEGGKLEAEDPAHTQLLLRTLAGLVVHPNVAAALLVDAGGLVSGALLSEYMAEHGYPTEHLEHRQLRLTGHWERDLAAGEQLIGQMIPAVRSMGRTPVGSGRLTLAQQCGGSDAFSGISSNPLIGEVSRLLIRHGGSALLAETDELMTAESHVLAKCSSADTAQQFVGLIDRFRSWAHRHGASPEGNPSGGNKFRGLYNISIKSLGAAMKRHEQVPLDACVEYGEQLERKAGPNKFGFMDSPGNDLESIAGQVASGCNVVFFSTGNGSVTNFPFVPTIKIVSTSTRYKMLSNEMDVDAGQYLLGQRTMEQLGQDTFELMLRVACGEQTCGEAAGHSQLIIWRNWGQPAGQATASGWGEQPRTAEPVQIQQAAPASLPFEYLAWESQSAIPGLNGKLCAERLILIVPTSLCSSQPAQMIAQKVNRALEQGGKAGIRCVALPHSEGCGSSECSLSSRVLVGHMLNPAVQLGLLLEHGCEKTHNDFFYSVLSERLPDSVDLSSLFGWFSLQLGGGLDQVGTSITDWATRRLAVHPPPVRSPGTLGQLQIAVHQVSESASQLASALAEITLGVVCNGGSVVMPSCSALLKTTSFMQMIVGGQNDDDGQNPTAPPLEEFVTSLQFGGNLYGLTPGLHVMEMPAVNLDWVEIISGLGSSGVQMIIVVATHSEMVGRRRQAHPHIPTVFVCADAPADLKTADSLGADVLVWAGEAPSIAVTRLLSVMSDVLSQRKLPVNNAIANTDFQITRGPSGISL